MKTQNVMIVGVGGQGSLLASKLLGRLLLNKGYDIKADVYKADTTLANSQLSLERAKNNREILKGTLLNILSFHYDFLGYLEKM